MIRTEWAFNKSQGKGKFFEIGDPVHGQIAVFNPIGKIINSPPIQRLRNIQQLSFNNFVYPSASHDRFSHSIGVYHLARKMATHLKKNQGLGITNYDILCVSIAALYHDAGHGPFSHFYEVFLQHMNIKEFVHEEMSCKIFDHYYNNDVEMKKIIDEYLDEHDRIFIKEMINPPKSLFDEKGQWQMKGRGKEKAFLYEIVNNPHNGLDVDKVDYLLRDSLFTNVGNRLRKNDWKRVVDYSSVTMHPEEDRNCISYHKKIYPLIKKIFEDRMELHKTVYQHKTAGAIKLMMLDVFILAKDHLKFYAKDGKDYTLTNAFEDVDAYLQIDNTITTIIKYRAQTCKIQDLINARSILEAIERREIPKLVCALKLESSVKQSDAAENIKLAIENKGKWNPELNKHIFTKLVTLHQGQGIGKYPMEEVVFYSEGDLDDVFFIENGESESKMYRYVYVYVSFEKRNELKEPMLEAIKSIRGEMANFFDESSGRKGKKKRKSDGGLGSNLKVARFEDEAADVSSSFEEISNTNSSD